MEEPIEKLNLHVHDMLNSVFILTVLCTCMLCAKLVRCQTKYIMKLTCGSLKGQTGAIHKHY